METVGQNKQPKLKGGRVKTYLKYTAVEQNRGMVYPPECVRRKQQQCAVIRAREERAIVRRQTMWRDMLAIGRVHSHLYPFHLFFLINCFSSFLLSLFFLFLFLCLFLFHYCLMSSPLPLPRYLRSISPSLLLGETFANLGLVFFRLFSFQFSESAFLNFLYFSATAEKSLGWVLTTAAVSTPTKGACFMTTGEATALSSWVNQQKQ